MAALDEESPTSPYIQSEKVTAIEDDSHFGSKPSAKSATTVTKPDWQSKRDGGMHGMKEMIHSTNRAKRVCLEDICVYDQIENQKILKYSKVLTLAQEGDKDKTQAAIQECFPDINTPINKDGKTALMLAAQHGHKVLMEALLDQGANMYLLDRDRASVLSLSKHHTNLYESLQSKYEDKLVTAAKEGNLSLVEKSLEVGVDPNAREKDEYGWTALLWACEKGHRDMVDYLLEHGANVDAEDGEKWTSLILCSRNGYLDIVRKLLDKGADVNKQNINWWSSLMWTAQMGHTEVARLLLERGADTTTRDMKGFTPLIQASQDNSISVVKLLVEHNSEKMDAENLDQRTDADWTAVMVATKNGHEDVVHYLVDHGFDVQYQKKDKVTALHIASYKGNNNLVRYLCLQQKLDVDAQDENGSTPLMYAAKQGNLEVVRTLIENGHADANIAEEDCDWTALFFAVMGGGEKEQYSLEEGDHNEVVGYLLRSGRVNMAHKDKWGNTIVDITDSNFYPNKTALECLSKYYKAIMEKMFF